jgi:hypothetical protein
MPERVNTVVLRSISRLYRGAWLQDVPSIDLGLVLSELLDKHAQGKGNYVRIISGEDTPLELSTMSALSVLMREHDARADITCFKGKFEVQVGLPVGPAEPNKGIWGHGNDEMLERALAKGMIDLFLNKEHYEARGDALAT